MGLMVFGVVTVVLLAVLVLYWAFLWEKDSGDLDPRTQARVEAVQEHSAAAAQAAAELLRRQVGAARRRAGRTLSRAKALQSKASTGTG